MQTPTGEGLLQGITVTRGEDMVSSHETLRPSRSLSTLYTLLPSPA